MLELLIASTLNKTPLHERALERTTGANISMIHRKLMELENKGVVFYKMEKNKKVFWLNTTSPLSNALLEMYDAERKITSLGRFSAPAYYVANEIKAIHKNVKSLYVFGSVAKGTATKKSDLDILVISKNLPDSALERTKLFLPIVKKTLKKFRVRPDISAYDLKDLTHEDDLLLKNIKKSPKIEIFSSKGCRI